MMNEKYYVELDKLNKLLERKNKKTDFYNGIYDRYEYPVLTREMIPLTWRYDLNPETNPYFIERLGVNAVMNSGAIYLNGKYYLVARIEGNDRKSFFGVAESDNGIDGFRFWDYPILLDDVCPEETNVYDMRLTQHEDGWIYGVFCSESKDTTVNDLSAAVAAAGIVRTKDLKHWERLDNLKTLRSPQQRNVVLHPEFVDGKYAFYTRPMDDFIETGSGSGIGFGLCDDIEHAVIDEEKMTSLRKYHTITEAKNGAGAPPIKTDKGWIHIACWLKCNIYAALNVDPKTNIFYAVYIGRCNIAVLSRHTDQRCNRKNRNHSKHKEENRFFYFFHVSPSYGKSGCSSLQATASVFVSSTLTRWYRQLLIIVLHLLRIVNRISKSCTIFPIPPCIFQWDFQK